MRGLRAPLAAALALVPGLARADLVSDGDDVAAHLRAAGLVVLRGESAFFDADGRAGKAAVVLRAPEAALRGAEGCATLVLVGPRTASLTAAPGLAAPAEDDEDGLAKSESGVLVVARCGARRAELARVRVEHGARGAVEVLWVTGATAALDALDALPERRPGPGRPERELLPPPPREPPFAARVERAKRRARGDGAEGVTELAARAGRGGDGELLVELSGGCHRIDVVAEGARVDVDAELHLGDRLIAKDRGEAVDASLEVCLARRDAVVLAYQGAPPDAAIAISVARWSLPAGLPEAWGPVARAAFARTLWRRRLRGVPARPVREALAVQGDTRVPVPVEPGRCYLAGAAAVEPGLRLLRLDVAGLRGVHRDETFSDTAAALAAFCVEDEEQVTLAVDARGAWITAAVWALE